MKHVRKLFALVPIVLGIAGPLSMGACSSASLVPAGGECLQATDCEPGLVCIPSGGKRVCSADLSTIATVPEAGGNDAAPRDGGLDVITYDADAAPPPKDTGVPDNNPPPPDSGPDTGGGQDSGSQDSGGGG